MIALKHILVPTDFSETSAVALKYARALAESFGATLHVMHVLEDPVFHSAGRDYFTPMINYREVMEKDARERLAGLVSAQDREKFNVQFARPWGEPFVEIVQYARRENIDLIVMGTHGLSRLAQALLGSVAERVVRKAPCPVLTVRHPEHEFVLP